ncbi:hypothetical protein EJ05DRAFT_510504 [Pseudovirgaria hyperparasitica]|uniref:ATPase inhibitor, mitochondrial n=1 Tax=Pseudovirgaria hyperparasitica TaxID=470096 RepID=A0A6A6W6T8_9PEZI|nr:uncharacterized protein EJ05DRAFT_510504 [Pseudovirgaria hyperparasitica]KAF2758598.1 hypothetical protein EJ05DRAFT_510504 [Pseudovirgaria hyperparasitica]
MIRATIIKSARPLANGRLFSTSLRTMAEGDTGAVRPGGSAQSDAFNKREKAAEDQYIRQEELEKIKQIREKISKEREHIDQLDKTLQDLMEKKGQK